MFILLAFLLVFSPVAGLPDAPEFSVRFSGRNKAVIEVEEASDESISHYEARVFSAAPRTCGEAFFEGEQHQLSGQSYCQRDDEMTCTLIRSWSLANNASSSISLSQRAHPWGTRTRAPLRFRSLGTRWSGLPILIQ